MDNSAFEAVFDSIVDEVGNHFSNAAAVGCDGRQIAGDGYIQHAVLSRGAQLHVVSDGSVNGFQCVFAQMYVQVVSIEL